MGICLDTEAKPLYGHAETFQSAQLRSDRVFVEQNGAVKRNGHLAHNGMAHGPHHELIRTPVVFVVGGPGSGKISHSERLARQRKGFVHINVIELLLQHLEGSDLRDVSLIPTSAVTKELIGAMKTRSNMKGFIISGYPRNMRDVADYLERVGRCDGVILINWQDDTLSQQIEYGSQIGEISLEQAKLELSNFRKHVIPVAEYFDYKQLLYVIQGERHPDNIFADFVEAFERILESEAILSRPRPHSSGSYRDYKHVNDEEYPFARQYQSATYQGLSSMTINTQIPSLNGGQPFVIWINGGPGSSKAERMDEIALLYPAWRIISTGSLLWKYLHEQDPRNDAPSNYISAVVQRSDDHITSSMIYNVMSKGEMVPQGIIIDLILDAMAQFRHSDVEGFFITGFPRDIVQAQGFEERTGLKPPCILIDCSELELGRNLGQRHGRIDDNVEAYRRRLELYRELTLPMLKTFDEQNRLKIIDGDSDNVQVVKELRRCLHREIGSLRRERAVDSIDEQDQDERAPEVNWDEEFPDSIVTRQQSRIIGTSPQKRHFRR